MPWIESDIDLPEHFKFKRVLRELGISRTHLMGHLHLFWGWVAKNAPDGDLSRFDPIDIEYGADWMGDPGEFVRSLTRAEFLDVQGDTLIVHNWSKRGGKLFAHRSHRAGYMREYRKRDDLVSDRNSHAESQDSHVTQCNSYRGEERRGDQIRGDNNDPSRGESAERGDDDDELPPLKHLSPPPSAPARRTVRRLVWEKPMTPENRAKLVRDYGDLPDFEERIEEALDHSATKKRTDEYLYLRGWLRREAEHGRRPAGNSVPRKGAQATGEHGSPYGLAAVRGRANFIGPAAGDL